MIEYLPLGTTNCVGASDLGGGVYRLDMQDGTSRTATAAEISAAVRASGVPASVTMRQARLALLGAGKLAAVTAAIASLPEPAKTAATITWEYSGEVMRHNGLVSQLGPALGLSEAQIDALFVAAAAL